MQGNHKRGVPVDLCVAGVDPNDAGDKGKDGEKEKGDDDPVGAGALPAVLAQAVVPVRALGAEPAGVAQCTLAGPNTGLGTRAGDKGLAIVRDLKPGGRARGRNPTVTDGTAGAGDAPGALHAWPASEKVGPEAGAVGPAGRALGGGHKLGALFADWRVGDLGVKGLRAERAPHAVHSRPRRAGLPRAHDKGRAHNGLSVHLDRERVAPTHLDVDRKGKGRRGNDQVWHGE